MRTAIVALFLVLPILSDASDDRVQVPFLFTEDQAAPQGDSARDLTPSDALRSDTYLNAPMTRLEYMLARIEAQLNERGKIDLIVYTLKKNFDQARHDIDGDRVRGFATYMEPTGKVVLGYQIDGMGRPRRPMRESCGELLRRVGMWLPQENMGFTLHNRVLGVLAQRDYEAYTPMLAKLAAQFVHQVQISSETEESKVHHSFGCQKTKDGPVTYGKYSFRLK